LCATSWPTLFYHEQMPGSQARENDQMMGLIGAELTCACGLGHLDHRSCPYHYDLREYVCLAVHVMRVCRRRVGRVDALSTVSEKVRMAGEVSAHAFLCWSPDPNGMGLCPIFQDGYKLGGYGVLHCGHTCIYIAGWSMRRMSVVGHLTAYRSALFVELGLRGLFAFMCDRVVPFPANVYCVEACRKL
jgi:hypothetical protein